MEPKDWINTGLEDEAAGVPVLEKQGGERTRRHRGIEVELRRKPGEGFGFVIASQDVENGKGKIQLVTYHDTFIRLNLLEIVKLLTCFDERHSIFLIQRNRIGWTLCNIS